jgi:endonuclease YncB( thermonuclease family)
MRPLLLLVLLLLALGNVRADDADTLTIDGTRYRLDGIDAPELDQNCLDADGELYPCGQMAVQELFKFIAGRIVSCDDRGPDTSHANAIRRIGQCAVDGVDLHRWLVVHGWAINFEPYARGRFKDDEREAREGRFGIWKGCFVAPQDFRRWHNRTAKLLGPTCPPEARAKLFPDHPRMSLGCEIKGKYAVRAQLSGHRGIYHVPGCGSYRRTMNPDRWFCSEDDAVAAGFRRSLTCWLR